MSEKVYSRNEEDWYDLCEIMESLEEDYRDGDEVEIREGKSVQFTHDEFINADRIIEDLQETAYDEFGEWQEDYLDDLAKDKEKISELKKLLIHFITNNAKPPKCFKVVDIKSIKVTVGK